MKEFFLILFFSKMALLTPDPVTLSGEFDLIPEEPLIAITGGAGLWIDITKVSKDGRLAEAGIVESEKIVRGIVPEGSISAVLYGRNETVRLDEDGIAVGDGVVNLVLRSSSGIPVSREFDRVRITTRVQLNDVQVYWKNYLH